MNSMDHHRRSSAALLFATACPSRPNFRCARLSARTPLCWSWKGNGAGAGARANEGKQALVICCRQQLWQIERSGFQRRTWVLAPERIMLARRERRYGAIGVIVDRSVPQITVRAGAAYSVASIDQMSGPVRERAWPIGAKAKLVMGIERRGTAAGGQHRESNAGYAQHFPQLCAFYYQNG